MKREIAVAEINKPAGQVRLPRQILELGKAVITFAGSEDFVSRGLLNRKYLEKNLILPVVALLVFTGCSSIQGTGGNQKVTSGRVAAYTVERQEQATAADPDPDPTYEWFY